MLIFVFTNTVEPPVSKHPKYGNCFFSSLQDVAYIGKLSLYSLHFLDPSQSEVTERACMLRLIQESQNRLKFEIENNEKKKLYQINAVEPWLTYYIVGPLKIKIVFHIIFYLQSCIFFYIQFNAQVQCLLIYECRLQLESLL